MHHHFTELGSGPSLLFLHGTGAGVSDALPMLERLATTHRVLAPDMPGYGGSAKLAIPSTVAAGVTLLAEDLVELGLGDGELDVVGHSVGAYRGLSLALNPGFRIGKLVSLAGFAALPEAQQAGLLQLAAGLRAGVVPPEVIAGLMFSARTPKEAALARATAWLGNAAAIATELEAVVTAPGLLSELPALETNITAITGDADAAMPAERSQELVSSAHHARLEIAPGLGHVLFLEDLEGIASGIASAL